MKSRVKERLSRVFMAALLAFLPEVVVNAQTIVQVNAGGTIADLSTNHFTFTVAGLSNIVDLDVRLSIQHTFDSDLNVYLKSPTGTEIALFFSVGADGDNFQDTYLDDEAGTGRIGALGFDVAPFAGPEYTGGKRYFTAFSAQSLATFLGENPNGTWTLRVEDGAPGDSGVLFKAGAAAPWGTAIGTQLILTVATSAANVAPSFTKGPDQMVLEDAGAQSVPNWAANISPGPLTEASQMVNFLASNDNPGLFSTQPAISPSGALTYTPAPNAHGAALVTVTLHDNGGTDHGGQDTSAPQTFLITIVSVNDPPVTHSQSVTLNENSTAAINLVAFDVEGDSLSYSMTSPAHGTLSGTAPNLTYHPAANFFGPDSFTFKVNDGHVDSASATVSITVNPVNNPPVAGATVSPLVDFLSDDTHQVVIAPNNLAAAVVLDGSLSTDAENDPLQYFWLKDGDLAAFASGVRATNSLAVGTHTITLVVDDGMGRGLDTLPVEVITPCQATAGIILQLDDLNIGRRNKQPLVASLTAACSSFYRGNVGAGVNQLQAFQHKVRAQVAPVNKAAADFLIHSAQEIIEAVSSP